MKRRIIIMGLASTILNLFACSRQTNNDEDILSKETEVNNGGYNQFYFNSSEQFYKLLPNALKRIGANKFSDLTKRANETFEKENPKITQHQDGTIEGF